MAKTKARVFLFHGSDSQASSRALRRWAALFQEKYGETTRYLLEADEMNAEQFVRAAAEAITAQALFTSPKLVVLKRVTAQEKGASQPYSKALVKLLEEVIDALDDQITLAVWEEKQLPETHVLHKWFQAETLRDRAAVHTHTAPGPHQLGQTAARYLGEQGFRLDREAEQWLIHEFRQREKAARLAKRLRSTEVLAEDNRMWWLYQLLDASMLRADGTIITREALQAGSEQNAAQPVSIFEVGNAITSRQWQQARRLLGEWARGRADDSEYFGLYAFLRTQFRKSNERYALQLLADMEIISKNFRLEQNWLANLFVGRLEQAAQGGDKEGLLNHRALWLATLPRS